ncbi:MAG: hypothetical protein ACI8Z0_000898 [Lentimonas sp.]|jgi:hypothetical protein
MSRKITRIVTEEADVGMTSFWEEAERSFEQTITVTQNGLPTELSMVQAVMQTLIKSALKGSPQSLRQVTELSRLTAEARKREILEEISQWEVIQGRQYQKYKAHRAAHGFDPMDFPHPSDIVLDRKSGVRIVGPTNLEEYEAVQNSLRVVDACLWQDAMDQKQQTRDGPSGAHLIATVLNNTIPRRLRLTDDVIINRLMQRAIVSSRELTKETRVAWARAGRTVARGQAMPDLEKSKTLIKVAIASLDLVMKDGLHGEELNRGIEEIVFKRFSETIRDS